MRFNLRYRIKGCSDVHVMKNCSVREIIEILASPHIEMTTGDSKRVNPYFDDPMGNPSDYI